MPGILRRTRAYLEFTLRSPGYFVDFLNFASDFAPDQLSDSGKLASFQNGAPNTLFSLEISGNAKCWGPSVFLFVFRKTVLSPNCYAADGRYGEPTYSLRCGRWPPWAAPCARRRALPYAEGRLLPSAREVRGGRGIPGMPPRNPAASSRPRGRDEAAGCCVLVCDLCT